MFYSVQGNWEWFAGLLGVIGTLTFIWGPHNIFRMSMTALERKSAPGPQEHYPLKYLCYLAVALAFLLVSAVVKGDWVLALSRGPIYGACLFAIVAILEDDGIFRWHEHKHSVTYMLSFCTLLTAIGAFQKQLQQIPYLVSVVDGLVLLSTVVFILFGQIPEIWALLHARTTGKPRREGGGMMFWRCVGYAAFIGRYAILGDWMYVANFAIASCCELVMVMIHISWSWASPVIPPEAEPGVPTKGDADVPSKAE